MCIRESYNPDGTLDPPFDSDGRQTTAAGDYSDKARAVTLQGDVKLLVGADICTDNGAAAYDFGILRYNIPVSYTHLRAHETVVDLVCRLLLANKTRQLVNPRSSPGTIHR